MYSLFVFGFFPIVSAANDFSILVFIDENESRKTFYNVLCDS